MKRNAVLVGLVVALSALTGAHAVERRIAAVDPGLLQASAPVVVVAHFRDGIAADIDSLAGTTVLARFESVAAVALRAAPAAVRALAERDDVSFVEADHAIAFDLDTATTGSRAKWVWDPPEGTSPVVVDGRVVDGSGVGIAIVDSGVDGLHPDFRVPGKLGGNWIVTQQGLIEADHTGVIDPHGTHVAGIAAGNGVTSGGDYKGAAPGATLYGFATNTHSLVTASVAFQWILDHGASLRPPINVLNNSWHCGSDACRSMNPDRLHIKLATKLAEQGVVISWAAGNRSGDGITSRVNAEALNPTPGIISVANYNDDERGARNKCIVGSSSRGAASDPTTWPDLAAPGWEISSTWAAGVNINAPDSQPQPRVSGPLPVVGQNNYRRMSGTS
ncbi:MAG TPA: S8 family serine peptidase, partial [Actinomycetota bacterium]|nr:S8 family serine peptidase [Actinomycetota bacterium]